MTCGLHSRGNIVIHNILTQFNVFPLFQFDDAIGAKELEMTDSEHSDAEVSYTDNGTFNLSRGQTPLTEGSEGTVRTHPLSLHLQAHMLWSHEN